MFQLFLCNTREADYLAAGSLQFASSFQGTKYAEEGEDKSDPMYL